MLASGNDAQAAEAKATASISSPIGVSALTDLAFGTIIPGAGGTVIINPDKPDSESRSSIGSTFLVSSVYHPALFSVIGDPKSNYHVRGIPTSIYITKIGGTEKMTVTFSFSNNLDGSQHGKLNNTGNGSFLIGGTLSVNANQTAGVYEGTFPVTILYN